MWHLKPSSVLSRFTSVWFSFSVFIGAAVALPKAVHILARKLGHAFKQRVPSHLQMGRKLFASVGCGRGGLWNLSLLINLPFLYVMTCCPLWSHNLLPARSAFAPHLSLHLAAIHPKPPWPLVCLSAFFLFLINAVRPQSVNVVSGPVVWKRCAELSVSELWESTETLTDALK